MRLKIQQIIWNPACHGVCVKHSNSRGGSLFAGTRTVDIHLEIVYQTSLRYGMEPHIGGVTCEMYASISQSPQCS